MNLDYWLEQIKATTAIAAHLAVPITQVQTADVSIAKTVAPTVTTPGAWVTFTISFGNAGSLPADNVAIADVLPSGLTNITYTYKLYYTGVLTMYDTYTWTVGTLGWNQGGVITITARVDPTIADPQRIITNTAEITTTTQEQYQVQSLPNFSTVTLTVQTTDVEIAKSVTPAILRPGDRLTYTIVYTNAGPAMAASTVITDLLHSWLISSSYSLWDSYSSLVPAPSMTYVWLVGDVPSKGWGIITVTAQVSPGVTSGGLITNDVSIATVTPESDYTDNTARAVNTLCIPPTDASFSYSPLPVIVNQPAFFTGTVSLGSPPFTYAWNWTDGTGSGNPISHTYTAPGNYTVSMTVTNACGQGVYSQTVSVCKPVAGASFTYTPLLPLVGQVVTLSASTSAGSGAISYAWAGDGGWTASGSVVTHAFASRSSHTVWLTATNACGQSAYSDVIFVREYDLTLNSPAAQQTGNPGSVLTYTLIVQNLGNYTDTFTLSKAGNVWTTTLPAAVGPVVGGGSAQFDVVVQIPGNASHGASDNVAITATSQGDGSKWDASTLTTNVHVGAITHGVAVVPHTATGNGDPGQTVTYTLRVTNTGSVADTIGLSYTGPATWMVTYSANPVSMGAGQGTDVQVYVGIPSSVPGGSTGVITVTATSQADLTKSDAAVLTTRVAWRFIYLPVVVRNASTP